MAGDVHQRVVVGDQRDAALDQFVLDAPDNLLVAGNSARGKDHGIARGEVDHRMIVVGDARQRGPRFTLTAGAQQQRPLRRQRFEMILIVVLEIDP